MNLASRPCPRVRFCGRADVGEEIEQAFALLRTLMMPAQVHPLGGATAWIHTPLGTRLIEESVASDALWLWLDVLMEAASVWTTEELRRLERSTPQKAH